MNLSSGPPVTGPMITEHPKTSLFRGYLDTFKHLIHIHQASMVDDELNGSACGAVINMMFKPYGRFSPGIHGSYHSDI